MQFIYVFKHNRQWHDIVFSDLKCAAIYFSSGGLPALKALKAVSAAGVDYAVTSCCASLLGVKLAGEFLQVNIHCVERHHASERLFCLALSQACDLQWKQQYCA